ALVFLIVLDRRGEAGPLVFAELVGPLLLARRLHRGPLCRVLDVLARVLLQLRGVLEYAMPRCPGPRLVAGIGRGQRAQTHDDRSPHKRSLHGRYLLVGGSIAVAVPAQAPEIVGPL